MDILGFEAIINNKEDGYRESEEFAEKILPIFNKILKLVSSSISDTFNISQFSDTFVISSVNPVPLSIAARSILLILLQEGVLSRGAITYGKVFHNGSQFIGPAITCAYKLEKSEAIYPRVIIDPLCEGKMFDDVRKDLLDDNIFKEYFDGWIPKDFDGYRYVNLFKCFMPDYDMQEMIQTLYEQHKNTKHRGKYTWLKQKADEFLTTK